MADQFDIRNHINYKEHMKQFISKEDCKALLKAGQDKNTELREKASARIKEERAKVGKIRDRARAIVARERQQRIQMEAQLNKMRDEFKVLLARCPPPVKDKCPLVPLEQHPGYIAMKKAEKKQQGRCTDPEVLKAKAQLRAAQEQCRKPKCDPEPITKHPDYESLMEECQNKIDKAKSEVEAEMKRKLRTDIRYHPDYSYFKSYYESKIADLQSKLEQAARPAPKCPECPKVECPKCPECVQKPCPTCKPTPCPKPKKVECPKCPVCQKCPKCPACKKGKPCPKAHPVKACKKCKAVSKAVAEAAQEEAQKVVLPAEEQVKSSKRPVPQAAAAEAETLSGPNALIRSGHIKTHTAPRPFARSDIPMLNPYAEMGQMYAYDPISF